MFDNTRNEQERRHAESQARALKTTEQLTMVLLAARSNMAEDCLGTFGLTKSRRA
jgi:hypothetical protein